MSEQDNRPNLDFTNQRFDVLAVSRGDKKVRVLARARTEANVDQNIELNNRPERPEFLVKAPAGKYLDGSTYDGEEPA